MAAAGGVLNPRLLGCLSFHASLVFKLRYVGLALIRSNGHRFLLSSHEAWEQRVPGLAYCCLPATSTTRTEQLSPLIGQRWDESIPVGRRFISAPNGGGKPLLHRCPTSPAFPSSFHFHRRIE